MNTTKPNTKNDAAYQIHTLPIAALAASLALMVGTLRAQAYECDCDFEIESGTVIIYGHLTVNCVNLGTGARLYINGRLTLNGSDCATSTINGKIYLTGANSVLEITDNDHTLAGSGEIIGQNSSACIEIADGLRLTSEITIEGALQIVGTAGGGTTRFINNGLVHANAVGTLDLAVDALDDGSNCSDGDWQVSGANASILEFSVGSILLSGDFTVNVSSATGKLLIQENVATEGDLTFSDGMIQVQDSGEYFMAKADCGCP